MNPMGLFQEYDEATKLKLEIFRNYTDIWLNIFIKGRLARKLYIYDLFAGPGTDQHGISGSPILLNDQIEKLLSKENNLIACEEINLKLSDVREDFILNLERLLPTMTCGKYKRSTIKRSFEDAINEDQSILSDSGSAKLLILDQFGFKDVSPEILSILMTFPRTDILFFVSSSYIHRFWDDNNIQRMFNPNKSVENRPNHSTIHRFICERYRQILHGKGWYFSHFSIKKDNSANIYGVIFSTKSLLGLDKFIEICWNKDKVTGEANFDQDSDRHTMLQGGLFQPKKLEVFELSLADFIGNSGRNNLEIYEFTLVNGFLPKHAKEILDKYRALGRLRFLQRVKGGTGSRSYGLVWDLYRVNRITFEFRMETQ